MEAHIRDVKEAAHQLNYNDDAVLHFIKAIMPSEIYGTLYNQNYLNMVITTVKDIHAKKPEPVSLSTATAAAAPLHIPIPMEVQKNPNWLQPQPCPRPMKRP